LSAFSRRSSADGRKRFPPSSASAAGSADEALLHFIPAASGAAASSVAQALARRPRLARSKTMEANMRVLTIIELMRLTRIELTDLLIRTTNALPDMPEGSENRQIALMNLRNIRWVLARHYLT
jgi:hypothetical protein